MQTFWKVKLLGSEILVWFARYVCDCMFSATCFLVLSIYVFSHPSLNKLQSRICVQFTLFFFYYYYRRGRRRKDDKSPRLPKRRWGFVLLCFTLFLVVGISLTYALILILQEWTKATLLMSVMQSYCVFISTAGSECF